MNKRLAGKIALVTGGSRGIGAAITRRLADEGAHVAFTYVRSAEKAEALAAEINASGEKAIAIAADSADPQQVTDAVNRTVSAFGGLHILVNNAGIYIGKAFEEHTLEDYEQIMAINVRAVYVAAHAAIKHISNGGRIITIGSTNADRMPFIGGAVYAMSKAAVAGLTRGLARDLGPRCITVNTIQPGPVDTDLNPADGPSAEGLKALLALGRYGTTAEIAGLVAYLAGPEAGYITGASLTIDGGFAT